MTSLQERLFAMQDKQYATFQAKLIPGLRLCQNADTAFFYAQSPDFLKPGLCYYPKFSYL